MPRAATVNHRHAVLHNIRFHIVAYSHTTQLHPRRTDSKLLKLVLSIPFSEIKSSAPTNPIFLLCHLLPVASVSPPFALDITSVPAPAPVPVSIRTHAPFDPPSLVYSTRRSGAGAGP